MRGTQPGVSPGDNIIQNLILKKTNLVLKFLGGALLTSILIVTISNYI